MLVIHILSQWKSTTYVHGHLDTTKVFALNVQAGSDLMFLVSGLLLTSQGDADFPVFLIDELTLGIRGQLVVGEREACLAVAVVDLQLAGGLLNLRAGAVFGDGALDLLLHVEALCKSDTYGDK